MVAIAVLIALAANAFALSYVSAEHYIYYWDWSFYWLSFVKLGELARTTPFLALATVSSSIRSDDYNLFQVVPLLPFEILGGASRTSYIVAITNMGVLPSAALLALVPEQTAEQRSWARYLLCVAMLLCLHPLWAGALRGFPDVIGVAVASTCILLYFRKPADEARTADFVRLGIAFCLLVIVRRWYIFWVAAFFPAAIAAYLAAPHRNAYDRRAVICLFKNLGIAGSVCVLFLMVLAGPLVVRAAVTDYSVAFAAYRSSLGPVAQVVDQFGLALLALAFAGLGWLVADRRTRGLGTLVIVQAVLSLALFAHVQELLGVQHYYILVPTVGIGVAAAVHAVWNSRYSPAWRGLVAAGIATIVLLSSLAAFYPRPIAAGAILPRNTYPPLVRPDLAEIGRLMSDLEALKPNRVYVAASSEALNWSTLAVGCRDRHPALCSHIAVTSDIDTRDGYPVGLLKADYAVLATPVQYHVRPSDQQIVGRVARDLSLGKGIGRSFQPIGREYQLKQGVRVQIYRRIEPLRESDLTELSSELMRSYPGMMIFKYPLP